MLLNKLKMVVTAAFLVSAFTSANRGLQGQTENQAEPKQPSKSTPRDDLYGDPLPDGAIARFGSARFRHAGLSDFVLLPDDRTVLTAGGDRVLRFWDLATGRTKRVVLLHGKAGPGSAVTLSPDGKTLVAHVSELNQLVFWDVDSGKELKTLPAPKGGRLGYLYFSPDGKTLAHGSGDWKVSLWDWKIGKELVFPLAFNKRPVIEFSMDSTFHGSFSPDGKWFVAGASSNEPLGVFEVDTGREIHRLNCSALTSIVSPDSKRLAVSSRMNDKGKSETVIRLFDLANGKEVAQFPFGDEDFFSLSFSPDGKVLACAFSDRSCLLDLTNGRVLHRLPGRPLAPTFSRDGKTLIASSGQRLRLWDVDTGKERDERPGDFGYNPALVISPDGRRLASGGWMQQEVSLWDTADGRILHRLPLKGQGRNVRNLAFSSDGKTLVACQGVGGLLQFWDVATATEQRVVQLRDPDAKKDDNAYFYNLHVSPDCKHVATLEQVFAPGGISTRLGFWDTSTGKRLNQQLIPGELRQAVWLMGGKSAVLPVKNGLTMMDVTRGTERLQFSSDVVVGPIVASPDGRLIVGRKTSGAGGKGDGTVVVWEVATGKEILAMATGRLDHLAMAPDNRSLVSTESGVLHLRDLATGKTLQRWTLPGAETNSTGRTFVFALHLSPDGRRAFTALDDGTALAWDVNSALHSAKPPVKETNDKELDAWWTDLSAEDAGKSQRAVWALADTPKQAASFLGSRLKPVAPPNEELVRRWIAELDSSEFGKRQAALKELGRLGELIEPIVTKTLAGKLPLETRRRLEDLLQAMPVNPPSSDELRRSRALQILELIGSQETQTLLQSLAKGAAGARQTREAQESLDRLAKLAKLAKNR